ncbi:MAG: TatD family hydrolase [Gammaproteobacteria bacterium]|nr:TatD family hydrolase [Gammaproteobacteria bacterium]
MDLIDIGANLTHASFEHDFRQVVDNARSAGLTHIILTGTDLANSGAAARLAAATPDFFSATAGFHPHVAQSFDHGAKAEIAALGALGEVVAVGETGLDFNRNYSPRRDQLACFEHHLEIAAGLGKPLFLHQRDAHGDFVALLRAHRDRIAGGVVHCFTDTRAALRDYLDLGMHIGITGWICDERRGVELQAIAKFIPPDRLLLETDAPYLLPRTLKPKPAGRRNEPKYLPAVLEQVAACTGRDAAEIARQTTANAIRLFGLPVDREDAE